MEQSNDTGLEGVSQIRMASRVAITHDLCHTDQTATTE